MSESAVRKLQPFTVGTRLSLPKCTDGEPSPGMATLDNGTLHRNLNDRVSLYLAQTQAGPSSPAEEDRTPRSCSPAHRITDEDRINRNALAARAIRKITLSNWRGGPAFATEVPTRVSPPSLERNLNNNNSRAARDLPRMAGVHRENRPKAQVKVFLRKELEEGEKETGGNTPKCLKPGAARSPPKISSPMHTDPGCPSASPPSRESLKKPGPAGVVKPSAIQLRAATVSSQFTREILQAESWIRGKLRDLKEGWDAQLTTPQDWEQAALTLQRDMKEFEHTMTRLSQMADHLLSKQPPNPDSMIRQMQVLKDQWHLLKQTATNQSKALGGARPLQEFKTKADQLESWIREKEESPCLVIPPEESGDKILLARRALDLKQEQQRFRNLQEEVTILAQKLEKQGRNENKSISTRRKHINKQWLRVQGTLRDHHNTLQLAMESATFYHQADTILQAMENKKRTISIPSPQAEPECQGDRGMREIASQIMMLDVMVSQLISLHPELVARVTQKHRQVKDCWGQLQHTAREDTSALRWLQPASSREGVTPVIPGNEGLSIVGKLKLGSLASGIRTEQRNSNANEMPKEGRAEERVTFQEQNGPNATTAVQEKGSDVIGGCQNEHQRKKKCVGQTEAHKTRPHPEALLQHFCQAAAQALCWLKENISSSAQWDRAESDENLEEMQKQQGALQQEILRQQSRIEAVQQEGKSLVRLAHPGSPRVEGILREIERLWGALQKRNHNRAVALQEASQAQRILDELAQTEQWLQDLVSSLSEPAVMRDPELIRVDLHETSSLETELSSRGMFLSSLKEQAGRFLGASRLHLSERMQRRLEAVEERFMQTKDTLRRRALDLRDSLILSEFLQNVQMEEKLSQRNLNPTAKRRLDFCEPLRLIPMKETQNKVMGENVDQMARPLGDLQEAVNMLNDAVKEREKVMAFEKETGSLANLLSDVSQRICSAQSQAEELGRNIQETERAFAAVKSEPGLEGLQELQDQQKEMECHISGSLKVVMEDVEKRAAHVEEPCPSQLQNVGREIRETLEAWAELQRTVQENERKLQRAWRLHGFFRSYLAMILWTEDTRTQVFSEGVDADGLPTAQREELGRKIEVKLKEFEDLADAGWRLIAEEQCLTDTIKERIEELQSMLGWVLVRWRAQKRQKNPGKNRGKKRVKEGKEETVLSAANEFQHWHSEKGHPERTAAAQQGSLACSQDSLSEVRGVERDQRVNLPGSRLPWDGQACDDFPDPLSPATEQEHFQEFSNNTILEVKQPHSALVLDPSETPVVVVPQPGTGSLGETVNLILSISRKEERMPDVQNVEDLEASEADDGLHRLSDSKPAGAKNFWKRCQGLIGSTFGSLKRKKKISRLSGEEVCTYLHVKDTEKDRKTICHSLNMPRSSKKTAPKGCSSPGPENCSGRSSAAFHTLPKISANSLFNSLKRKEKARPEAQRLTVQKIMGAQANGAKPLPELNGNGLTTWPLKRCKKKASIPSPALEGFLDYMKNPLARDIDAECGALRPAFSVNTEEFKSKTSGLAASKSALASFGCKHLSLGSVLSLELPKDLSLLGNFQDNIKISTSGPEMRLDASQDLEVHVDVPAYPGTYSFVQDTKAEILPRERPHMESEKSKRDDEREDASSNPQTHDRFSNNHCARTEEGLPQAVHRPDLASGMHEDNRWTDNTEQKGSTEDLLDFKLNRLSRISVLHEQMDHEWDRLAARMKTCTGPAGSRPERPKSCALKLKERVTSKKRTNSPNRPTVRPVADMAAESPSKVGLCTHPLQMSTISHSHEQSFMGSPTNSAELFQQVEANIKPSSQLSVLHYERNNHNCRSFSPIKLDSVRTPTSAEKSIRTKPKTLALPNRQAAGEVLHPNHEAFEEVEEELEGIWKNVENYKSRRGKDTAHTVVTKAAERGSLAVKVASEPPCRDAPSGPLILASAPNVLVAKFTLPPSARIHQNLETRGDSRGQQEDTDNSTKLQLSLPARDKISRQVPLADKTPSALAEAPCIQEHLSSTYRYQEMDNDNGIKPTSPHKKDFQLMEGPLEKKHVLQSGGRKATCRTWSKFHAVLVRRTLCCYQDRKDLIKSSTGAVPLNLSGALCTPDMEYTKKSNCFRLQMQDGSEVLLRAPSGALMAEWVSKIQQNSGFDDDDFFHAAARPPEGAASPTGGIVVVSGTGRPSSSHLSGYHRPSPIPVKEVTALNRPSPRLQWTLGNPDSPKEASPCRRDDVRSIHVATAERFRQWTPTGSPRLQKSIWNDDEDPALVANQRRSRSFTSATYQKVTPVSLPAGSLEAGGSYSVTLFIADQSTPMQRVRRHSLASKDPNTSREKLHQPDWQVDTPQDGQDQRLLGTYTPPKNKSVFKKFFRMKD